MRFIPPALATMLAAALLTGCGPRQPFVTDSRLERGLVIVLTGIEGRSFLNEEICRGLNDGGVSMGIHLRDWTGIVPVLLNLQTTRRNRRKASEIADSIVRYRMGYPYRPVFLVGQSGGGAMALWVAEALPPELRIDGIILLAAAISPQYPLDQALQHVRRGIVSFYSPRDWVFLGVGTFIYGTMDRAHTSSAGRLGFEVPAQPHRAWLYDKKLFQIAWQPEMAHTGHHGGHLDTAEKDFVAGYAAPFIRHKPWTRQWVADALGLKVSGAPPEAVPAESAKPPAPPASAPTSQQAQPTTQGVTPSDSEPPIPSDE